MAVLKRTSNSVKAEISSRDSYMDWQCITVGGSVIFEWKVSQRLNTGYRNYFIKFSKKIPSDKWNYIVTYTHWSNIFKMATTVMKFRSDHFGVVYCPDTIGCSEIVEVEISTDQLSPFASIYEDAELTDFMLRGEDGTVPFHKVVIAAHSSVFKTMLAGEWKETSEGVIDVPGTSKEMLQHLKMYMYLGKLPGKQNEQVDCIKQLLLLSSCYLIEDLTLRCIKELRFLQTPENIYNMMQYAMDNDYKQLFVEILDCVAMGDVNMKDLRKQVETEDEDSTK